MTATLEGGRASAPWHYWVVVVVAVLWNGFGGYDFVMSNVDGDAYMRGMGMTDAQIAYFHGMPPWMIADWAVGVWGAVLGSILLIFRSKWALWAFVASLIGMLGSWVYTHVLTDGGEIMGQQALVMSGIITAACVFFVWYAWLMTKRGVLR